MASSDPVYLRVVEDLRRQIVDGTLPPGASVPSRAQLTRKYGVGETAARHALRVLAAEGLIYGRVGSGHYVRERPALAPLTRWPPPDAAPDSGATRHPTSTIGFPGHVSPAAASGGQVPQPFTGLPPHHGRRLTWAWRTERMPAPHPVADRLRVPESTPVLHTRYIIRSNGRPLQLISSYTPLDLVPSPEPAEPATGTAEGADGGPGILARLSALGLKVTKAVESVQARVPEPTESDALQLATGVCVLHVERTHWTADRPVETSDTVVSADRFRMLYTLPFSS